MKTVLLFGTFDGLHEGHKTMLREAWQHGDRIVVALAPDPVVRRLKGKEPVHTFEERADELEASGLVDEVIKGDEEPGTYGVLALVKPDVIGFGYDQTALQENLLAFLKEKDKSIATVTFQAFEPERYKSSLLNPVP